MRRTTVRAAAALAMPLALAPLACGGADTGTITIVAHDSFTPSEGIFDAFTARTGLRVEVVRAGDAGQAVTAAGLTPGNPVGDVLWGADTTLLSRAIDDGIFEPYESPNLAAMPPDLAATVPGREATPVDTGDVCINYDIAWFASRGIQPPATFEDLADPRLRDLLVVPSPLTSSPGLAFLLGTITELGDGWEAYWQRLRDNGVLVVDGWTEAYTVEFSGSSGSGPRPIVVSYATSPPAEVLFADPPVDEAPTAVATATCTRQVEYAGVLRGTDQPDGARQLVDFLTGPEFQADLPLTQFVHPVRRDVALPDAFVRWAARPEDPIRLDPAEVSANRAAWLERWTDLVLR
ncbi:MAG: thiamine ABC transporter substrate-binding protein [Actinobacteria bacterium]|nr:thiamine ABC transporter substrate-binding protein [Actinomycetota bacterium]